MIWKAWIKQGGGNMLGMVRNNAWDKRSEPINYLWHIDLSQHLRVCGKTPGFGSVHPFGTINLRIHHGAKRTILKTTVLCCSLVGTRSTRHYCTYIERCPTIYFLLTCRTNPALLACNQPSLTYRHGTCYFVSVLLCPIPYTIMAKRLILWDPPKTCIFSFPSAI